MLVKWTVPAYLLAMLLKTSRAVTVKEKAEFAVAWEGADTAKCVAAPPPTAIAAAPLIEAVTVSAAVRVWLPVVFRVAVKVPVPLVKVAFAGSTAWASLLVKCTVPLYQRGREVGRILRRHGKRECRAGRCRSGRSHQKVSGGSADRFHLGRTVGDSAAAPVNVGVPVAPSL